MQSTTTSTGFNASTTARLPAMAQEVPVDFTGTGAVCGGVGICTWKRSAPQMTGRQLAQMHQDGTRLGFRVDAICQRFLLAGQFVFVPQWFAAQLPPRSSRIGQSGRSSPAQECTRWSSTAFIACISRMRASNVRT